MRIGIVLVVCYLVAWLDRMAINMAVPFIAADLGIGPDRVGWILSAFFLGYAICQVPGGLLADRFGPRIVIVCALAWWTLFTGFTGLASSLGVLLVVRFLFGMGEGMFPAAVWKVLAQTFTTKNRATANSLVLSSIAIGPALTPLALAPMLSTWGWRISFGVLGVAGLAALALAHRYLKVPREPAAKVSGASLRDVASSRVVWSLALVALAGNIAMYGWLNWLPTYLMKVKGMQLGGMAWAASVPFAFGAVGCMLAGYVSDR
jgi:MFS family permease